MGSKRLSICVPSISFRANEMGLIHVDRTIVNKTTGTAEGSAHHAEPEPYHNPVSVRPLVPMNLTSAIDIQETPAAAPTHSPAQSQR